MILPNIIPFFDNADKYKNDKYINAIDKKAYETIIKKLHFNAREFLLFA